MLIHKINWTVSFILEVDHKYFLDRNMFILGLVKLLIKVKTSPAGLG